MASFINVFVRTPKPLEALVSEVGRILGIQLVPRPDDFGALYGAAFMGVDVAIFEAIGYVADRDMDFPSYQVDRHGSAHGRATARRVCPPRRRITGAAAPTRRRVSRHGY